MDIRNLGYRTNLEILRRGGSVITPTSADEMDYLVTRTPANPSYWWGNFLLLQDAPDPATIPAWQARFAEQLPAARHTAIGFDTTDALDEALLGPWRAAGYEVTHDVVLTADVVSEPPRPNHTATYRPLADLDDWAASMALQMACNDRDLPGYDTYVADSADVRRQLVDDGHAVWVGAFLDGDLVAQMGLVDCGAETARYQHVETHPAMRGRGYAGTLLAATARFGAALWAPKTFVIVADPGYHAVEIYRRAGFRDTQVQTSVERQPDGSV